jgi:hypothetical protein
MDTAQEATHIEPNTSFSQPCKCVSLGGMDVFLFKIPKDFSELLILSLPKSCSSIYGMGSHIGMREVTMLQLILQSPALPKTNFRVDNICIQ